MERKSRQLNDDDFLFDVGPISDDASTQSMSSFQRTTVTWDRMTGEISGWDEFYELVSMTDPSIQEVDLRAKQQTAIE